MNIPFLTALWLRMLSALIAGLIVPFSFAPYNIWPLGILSIAIFSGALSNQSTKRCLQLAFIFGLGLYGHGAGWVYISISQFGSSSIAIALAMTCAFVAGLAFCFCLPFYVYGQWFSRSQYSWVFAFPAIWVLGEWMRSWFLTGFPWLYLGYAHIDTWYAGWAPILGVFGLSFLVAFCACGILFCIKNNRTWINKKIIIATSIACTWLIGLPLTLVSWTTLEEKPITVGMAQGNISQDRKWDPLYLIPTFRIFNSLSDKLWQYDWVIWPEAAIPLLYSDAKSDLESLSAHAKSTNSVFITGILYDDLEKNQIYNSIVAVGNGSGITFKTRLVPFGEYVPLENLLRGLIDFFNLPTSIIHIGPEYDQGLQANGVEIGSTICYEVVYPDLVAKRAATANVLLTISNDGWFGLSIGPVQHFQMAQMRALETGRYMVRSTNNGISGIIDSKGKTLVTGGRFTREAIVGKVHSATGNTPFIIWRSWPVVLGCFALVFGLIAYRRKTMGSK